MALTIPPAFCTDQPYPFSILRKQMASLTSAGIVHPGDMTVSPASGLQVQISAGEASVQQTGATEGSEYNGLYYELNDAPANPFNTISAPLSNPRIDFVVLRVYDVTELGISGSSFARYEWVQGSENASASLTTMGPGLSNPGAPTLPASSLLLAYVLQTVGESSISGGNILNISQSTLKPWTTSVRSSSFTCVDRGSYLASSGDTATLPIAIVGSSTRILADATVTGASPVLISRSGADLIYGKGLSLSGATSFPLGEPGANVELQCFLDGQWEIVSGQQDTGWVALTLTSGITAFSGDFTPSVRVRGDRGEFCGAIQNASGSTIVSPCTVPTVARPPSGSRVDFGLIDSNGTPLGCALLGTGAFAATLASGALLGLDTISYRVI